MPASRPRAPYPTERVPTPFAERSARIVARSKSRSHPRKASRASRRAAPRRSAGRTRTAPCAQTAAASSSSDPRGRVRPHRPALARPPPGVLRPTCSRAGTIFSTGAKWLEGKTWANFGLSSKFASGKLGLSGRSPKSPKRDTPAVAEASAGGSLASASVSVQPARAVDDGWTRCSAARRMV